MAINYDVALVDAMRAAMDMRPGISEKRMFGGIFWMLHGNMLCSVGKHGLMFRVGKEHEAEALEWPGAREMDITKRRMPGFIRVDSDEALETGLAEWVAFAVRYAGELPPKQEK